MFPLLAILTVPSLASADLELPVKGAVTSGVGWRVDPFGSGKRVFHRGTDIAVPVGTPVQATRKGRVVLAGDDGHGHGSTIVIEHDNGDRTLYGHNSALLVRHGDLVDSGTVVALSGNSGRSTGPHVHYELQPSGRPYRPEPDLQKTDAPAEVAEITLSKQKLSAGERRLLEQKMDDSVNSILRALGGSAITGHGG